MRYEINISNEIFGLKEMYSELLNQMPIKLHPKPIQMTPQNSVKLKKKSLNP